MNLDQATITASSGPKYDQAYLNELKASTPSARPSTIANSISTPNDNEQSLQIMDVEMGEHHYMPSLQHTNRSTEETTTIIPSESLIKTAKERRERLRKTGVSTEEDYISLSVTRREDIDQGPHPESRLVREEDELGEGDDGMFPLPSLPIPS